MVIVSVISKLVPNKRVILMGTSLGSYPSCWLVSLNPDNLIGLILCVPFNSFFMGSYDNYSLASSIMVPTFIIKSEYDEIVPINSDENLSTVMTTNKLIIVLETHKTYLNDIAKDQIEKFVTDLIE